MSREDASLIITTHVFTCRTTIESRISSPAGSRSLGASWTVVEFQSWVSYPLGDSSALKWIISLRNCSWSFLICGTNSDARIRFLASIWFLASWWRLKKNKECMYLLAQLISLTKWNVQLHLLLSTVSLKQLPLKLIFRHIRPNVGETRARCTHVFVFQSVWKTVDWCTVTECWWTWRLNTVHMHWPRQQIRGSSSRVQSWCLFQKLWKRTRC